jgi:opacity protein-like surface antigen
MKRIILVALLVLALAVAASAESQIKPAVYAGGGIGLLSGPTFIKDYWKMGMGFGGGVGFAITPNIEIVGKVFYNQFPLDDDKILQESGAPSGVTIDGLDFRVIEFGADVKYLFTMAPDSKVGPFLVAGVGASNYKFTDVTVSDPNQSISVPTGQYDATDLSFSGGGGVEFMVSPTIAIWVDARFAYIASEGDAISYIPVRAGVKIGFGGGNGGM